MKLTPDERNKIQALLVESPQERGGYYDLVEVLRSITEDDGTEGVLERFDRALSDFSSQLATLLREHILNELHALTEQLGEIEAK
jgi:hypothetical protein